MSPRQRFPRLNHLFDVKHIVLDLKKGGIDDKSVYDEAVKSKRLVITLNGNDFKEFKNKSKQTGIIAISHNLLKSQIDKKLTALLIRSTGGSLFGKFTSLTGET